MKRFAILFAVLVGLASIQSAARACDYQQSFAAPACYVQPAVQIQSYAVQPVVQYQGFAFQQQYVAPVRVKSFQSASYGAPAAVSVNVGGQGRVGFLGGRSRVRSVQRVRVR